MKKQSNGLRGVLAVIIILGGLVTNVGAASAANGQIFTQEELVSLSRPSVVRIIQKVKGEIIIKPFNLDLDKLTISSGGGETRKIPVDDYMTGSGFIVSEDGYILTNSHVISEKEIKQQYIADVATSAVMDASLFYLGNSEELNDVTKMEDYAKRINEYLLKESAFNLVQNTVVLNPASKGEKIDDLIAEAFPISVVSINDNYDKDFWDIALIKIEQKNLPVLPLGASTSIKRGEKIGVFGFPTTAELNNKNLLESTFSQGVVSAIKDSENKDFNIIQTDAKISTGSSGSPLLNESGEVIGMITYQTNELDEAGGDNFAFAIPIDVVQEGVKKFNLKKAIVKYATGNYYTQFSDGLRLMHEARCQKALVEFSNAKNTNEKFKTSANIETYEKKCQELIAKGKSIDTRWDEIKNSIYALSRWIWAIVAVVILLFFAFSLKLFFMKRRLRKDEKEIIILEEEIRLNDERDQEEQNEISLLKEQIEQNKEGDAEELREIKAIEKDLEQLKNNKH